MASKITPHQFHERLTRIRDALGKLHTDMIGEELRPDTKAPDSVPEIIAVTWLGAVLKLLDTQVDAGPPLDEEPN